MKGEGRKIKFFFTLFLKIVLIFLWLYFSIFLLIKFICDREESEYYIWYNTEELSVQEFNDRYVKEYYPTYANEIKLPEDIHITKMVSKTYRAWDSTHYGIHIYSDYSREDWENYLDQEIPDLPLDQDISLVCKHIPEYRYGIFYDPVEGQVMLCDFRLNRAIEEQGEYHNHFWALKTILQTLVWLMVLVIILQPKILFGIFKKR